MGEINLYKLQMALNRVKSTIDLYVHKLKTLETIEDKDENFFLNIKSKIEDIERDMHG
jgi:hypothetical protein